MHALARFHLPRASAVTVVAAILAIVITLVLAAGVAGLRSNDGRGGLFATPTRSLTSVGAQPGSSLWGRGPFALLTDPSLRPPWTAPRP